MVGRTSCRVFSSVSIASQPQLKEDLVKNKLGVGVQFCMGRNGSKKLDAFFTEVKAKGIPVINERNSIYEERNFDIRHTRLFHRTHTPRL